MRQWVFLYDADCGMCTRFTDRVQRWDRHGLVRAVSLWDAEADRIIPEIPEEQRLRFAFLRAPDGRLFRGPDAITELIALLPGAAPVRWVRSVPGYAWIAGSVYGWISSHRPRGACGSGRGG